MTFTVTWNFNGFGWHVRAWVAMGVALALEFLCELACHPGACWLMHNRLYWWADRERDAWEQRVIDHYRARMEAHRQPPTEPYLYTLTSSHGSAAEFRYTPERGLEGPFTPEAPDK